MDRLKLKQDYFAKTITKADYLKKINDLHRVLSEYSDFISGTEIDSIIISKTGVTYKTIEGNFFENDADDEHIPPKIAMNMNAYEKEELNMMDKLISLSNAKCILDIGTNIGWMSIHFLKKFTDSRVISFEPIPVTYDKLLKNFAINNLSAADVYNTALGDYTGTVEFSFYPEGSGGASLADNSGRDSVVKVAGKITKLDTFCAEKQIIPDFIKCDVEGAELFVYRGGLEIISKSKPVIFSEMLRKWSASFNYHPNDIISLLAEKGYECFCIDNENIRQIAEVTDSTIETNFIFLHKEKHSDIKKTLNR